jgi:hypothetical protein
MSKNMDMIGYFKLMSGGSTEYNFANLTAAALIVDDRISYPSEKSGNVCGLYTFEDRYIDSDDGPCYTNPISEL